MTDIYQKVTRGHYEIFNAGKLVGEVWDEWPRKSSYSEKWQGGYLDADGKKVRIKAYSLTKFKRLFAARDCQKCGGRGRYDDPDCEEIPWALCQHS